MTGHMGITTRPVRSDAERRHRARMTQLWDDARTERLRGGPWWMQDRTWFFLFGPAFVCAAVLGWLAIPLAWWHLPAVVAVMLPAAYRWRRWR